MRTREAIWLAGAVGAFCLGWLAARGLTGGLDSTDTPVAERLTPTGSHLDADSQDAPSPSPESSRRLQGAALRSAVEAIASLNVSEGGANARSVIQLVEFADQLSAADFPVVLAMLGESGKAPHEAIRAELLACWIDKDAIKARAYFTSLSARERERYIGPASSLGPVVDALARVGADSLLTWLKSLSPVEQGAIRDSVRMAVAEVLARQDPEMAIALLHGRVLLGDKRTTLDFERLTALYQRRWKIEERHKSIKQSAAAAPPVHNQSNPEPPPAVLSPYVHKA